MTDQDPFEDNAAACFGEAEGGEIIDCVVDGVFTAGPSGTVIGLLMGAFLVGSLYIAGDGDIVVPAVVSILVGSAMVPLLPAQMVSMAYALVVVGIASAMMVVARRYVLRGGF